MVGRAEHDVKGIFFNLAQEVVEDRFGADRWDDAVALAAVDGAYTWLGTYPDGDLSAIVRALSVILDLTAGEVLVLVGRGGFASLAAHHGAVLAGIDDWRSLLASLDRIIHPEARMLHPDATPPRFVVLGGATGEPMRLEYRSGRALCALAEGLVLGVGDWFGAPLSVAHRLCVHRGDGTCVIEVDDGRRST